MPFHVLYRKPQYHKGWPWSGYHDNALEVVDFINMMNKMNNDYEFRVFEEISLSDLADMAGEELYRG